MSLISELEDDLKKRLHSIPQPPDGFDPLHASADELARYGLPPRPNPDEQDEAFQVWRRTMSPPLTILPWSFPVLDRKFDYQLATQLLALRLPASGVIESSRNWSGGVITANHRGSFWMVFGSWRVPNPDPPAGAGNGDYRCSTWVGLDGLRRYSDSLPQLGTTQKVVVNGGGTTRTVEAWWQWWIRGANYPPMPFPAGFTANIGDVVTCGLVVLTQIRVLVFIKNQTNGLFAHYDVDAPGPAAGLGAIAGLRGAHAEWIVERPMVLGSTVLYPLADYTSVTFNDCMAVVSTDVRDLRGARFLRMTEQRQAPVRSAIVSSSGKTGALQTVMQARYRA